jgi:hypothetical protein
MPNFSGLVSNLRADYWSRVGKCQGKGKFMKILLQIILILFISAVVFSQPTQTDKWVRIQSDNGEFSIEVPVKFNYIIDKDGFQISDSGSNNYQLKNLKILNAYLNQTLISFEIYEAKEIALDTIYSGDLSVAKNQKKYKKSDFTETKIKANDIKQLIIVTKDLYTIRRYFNSKNFIYILTAVSRKGENETIKRFFESLVFNPDTKQSAPNSGLLLSSLPTSNINLVTKNVAPFIPPDKNKAPDEPGVLPLAVGWKPAPSYVDNARVKGVQGEMQLRCTFAKDGFIPKIEFISLLPEGIARQVLFAALRIKFLPKEKDGVPETTERVVQYNFSLY